MHPIDPESPESPQAITATLTSEQNFDICIWFYDNAWEANPLYNSCSGEGGVFPQYPSMIIVDGVRSVKNIPLMELQSLMTCIVPAQEDVVGDYIYRLTPTSISTKSME